jgi:hypothetical protein
MRVSDALTGLGVTGLVQLSAVRSRVWLTSAADYLVSAGFVDF